MTAPKDGTLREALDRADPNTLADIFRKIAIGSLMQGQINQVRRKVDMDALGASAYTLSTLDAMHLPDTARASKIVRATIKVGTGAGEPTIDAYGTTPLTTHISIAPNGDIVTLGTDSVSDLDVIYVPERGDVIESVFPVVTNAIALPSSITDRGAILLLEAESLEGTVTGDFVVLVPSDSNPGSTKQANLKLAKDTVLFKATDGVTRARVKLLVTAAEDLATQLEAASTVI